MFWSRSFCLLTTGEAPLNVVEEYIESQGQSKVKTMLVNKAYKFRIYRTKEQEILIAKTIGCSRFVFNHFLGKWNDTYKETGKGLTYHSCSAELTQLKKESPTSNNPKRCYVVSSSSVTLHYVVI